MAAWDRTYQFACPPDPGVGNYYTLTVNKPANRTLTSKVGKGTLTDPWILTYTTSAEAANTTHGPHNLSTRKAGAEIRNAYLEMHVPGGPIYKDRPKVRDGVSGGTAHPKKKTAKKKVVKKTTKKTVVKKSKTTTIKRAKATKKKAAKRSARKPASKARRKRTA